MDDGQVKLIGVELEACQSILLPRVWDDSDRQVDENPTVELTVLAERVKDAMEKWGERQ
jgi:hypothetical protein